MSGLGLKYESSEAELAKKDLVAFELYVALKAIQQVLKSNGADIGRFGTVALKNYEELNNAGL